MKVTPFRLALVAGTALVAIAPAHAQDSGAGSANDIVVTARRTEERLQDVPISITVFNQQQLQDKNLTNAEGLATYTPSLSSNGNFGGDNTTFALRGFTQDIGTAPSVGTYFGDVVVPRGGSNGQPIGDNASPGDFMDLQNVQVLKGPQGTLFGRNTTGGAVLFVPHKPTDRFEGSLEGSYGNYDMKRVQAMINIPINDTFKVRAAFDHMDRDGWLHNISGIGPKRFYDTDYYAGRVSVVANLTPDIENYTIVSYTRSRNHGGLNKLVYAEPTNGLFGGFAAAQLAEQNATGNFYTAENALSTAGLKTTQWQIINNTTWRVSDSITIHNIASYAQLTQKGSNPIFGVLFKVPVGGAVYPTDFQESVSPPNGYSANEATITEEFRLEGTTPRFNWQAGAYYELAQPLSEVGSQSAGFANCRDGNGATFNCTDTFRGFLSEELGFPAAFLPAIGNINYTVGRTLFHDVGLFAQGTYKLTEQLKLTGGFRYTFDHQTINTTQRVYQIAAAPNYGVTGFTCTQSVIATPPDCRVRLHTQSRKPTWLADIDYNPVRDVLIYAKYSRGYRAATIAPNIPIGGTVADPDDALTYVKPEKVDAYEVGLKSTFGGALHATFNVAGFYNKFSNQQLQVGFLPNSSLYPQTAAPVNAGKSTIYGAEIEAGINPFTGLQVHVGYTYLHTRIDQVNTPLPTNFAYRTVAFFRAGDPEVLSPRHKVSVNADYLLPLPASYGKFTIGAGVTYRSSMLTNYIDLHSTIPAERQFAYVKGLTLVDANLNWVGVAGSPFDLGFFATNLTKRKYYTYSPGFGASGLGFELQNVGEPRFFGGRVSYHFSN